MMEKFNLFSIFFLGIIISLIMKSSCIKSIYINSYSVKKNYSRFGLNEGSPRYYKHNELFFKQIKISLRASKSKEYLSKFLLKT
ncbi:MAG: hypothetical protein [Bacteriophage sp.]|nr:MAG: hypothetical protein [Bacteriophage sp.]